MPPSRKGDRDVARRILAGEEGDAGMRYTPRGRGVGLVPRDPRGLGTIRWPSAVAPARRHRMPPAADPAPHGPA